MYIVMPAKDIQQGCDIIISTLGVQEQAVAVRKPDHPRLARVTVDDNRAAHPAYDVELLIDCLRIV
jgi:hypothetical protein